MQSTTHNGWGARDNLPLRETRRNQTHVQAATLAVAVVDYFVFTSKVLDALNAVISALVKRVLI